MKMLLRMCGIVFFFFLVMAPVAANISGTDIPLHSPYIIEGESGDPYFTYSKGFVLDQNWIVWETYRLKQAPPKNISSIIQMMNVSDGEMQVLATSPSSEHQYMFDTPFSTENGRVVWSENSKIFLYVRTTGKEKSLTTDESRDDPHLYRQNRNPIITSDRIIWIGDQVYPSTRSEIFLLNLTSQNRQLVFSGPGKIDTLSADGSRIVWVDKRNEPGDGDIYLYDIDQNEERPLCTAPDLQQYPRISGDYVVWEDFRDGIPAIYLYNLTSRTESRISDLTFIASMPYISGNYIAWTQYDIQDRTREKSRTIMIYNIGTGEKELFRQGARPLTLQDFRDNHLLYSIQDDKTLQEGYVHMFVIDRPVPFPSPTFYSPAHEGGNYTSQVEYSREPTPLQSASILSPLLIVCSIFLVYWAIMRIKN
jgi:beta propeller repeat protein